VVLTGDVDWPSVGGVDLQDWSATVGKVQTPTVKLIRLLLTLSFVSPAYFSLLCTDTVGQATGRAFGILKKLGAGLLVVTFD